MRLNRYLRREIEQIFVLDSYERLTFWQIYITIKLCFSFIWLKGVWRQDFFLSCIFLPHYSPSWCETRPLVRGSVPLATVLGSGWVRSQPGALLQLPVRPSIVPATILGAFFSLEI